MRKQIFFPNWCWSYGLNKKVQRGFWFRPWLGQLLGTYNIFYCGHPWEVEVEEWVVEEDENVVDVDEEVVDVEWVEELVDVDEEVVDWVEAVDVEVEVVDWVEAVEEDEVVVVVVVHPKSS